MPELSNLPTELLLDNILPELAVGDLLALSATSKDFASLASDDTFWKRKLEQDFNFFSTRTARANGWKDLYKGLSNPELYRWGAADHGRIGDGTEHNYAYTGLPFPKRLILPGVRVVDIVAGGWSFHALDAQGNIYVWGTLDGESMALNRDGFAVSEKVAQRPLKLSLPAPVHSISCSRKYSMALDANGHIWTFISWGRPYKLTSPLVDCTSADSTPTQIECGWGFSSALTASGDVLVWFPRSETVQVRFTQKMEEMRLEGGKDAHATSDGLIPCATWDFSHDVNRLPPIPRLPELREDLKEEQTKLIKIAGMDGVIIGLTNKGHVLRFDNVNEELATQRNGWIYLEYFSETQKVQQHPAYATNPQTQQPLVPPSDLRITHISAHFRKFFAYSVGEQSSVFMGDSDDSNLPDVRPKIIPALQNINIISVVLGDYHYGALTADGKLLTWGAYSRGALGLGDPAALDPGQPGGYRNAAQKAQAAHNRRITPPDVETPTEVRWDHATKHRDRKKFCFGVTAAGWHMAALVIDLEGPPQDDDDDYLPMPGDFEPRPPRLPQREPGEFPGYPQQPLEPMLGRGMNHFRIGYAGRGRGLGRGGRGNDPA